MGRLSLHAPKDSSEMGRQMEGPHHLMALIHTIRGMPRRRSVRPAGQLGRAGCPAPLKLGTLPRSRRRQLPLQRSRTLPILFRCAFSTERLTRFRCTLSKGCFIFQFVNFAGHPRASSHPAQLSLACAGQQLPRQLCSCH